MREGGGGFAADTWEGKYFVAVTGLVPLRKQVMEYLSRFRTAAEFLPERDVPNYVDWSLERAEVTNQKIGPWQEIATTRTARRRRGRMESGVDREVAAPDCIDPGLTMPIPPLQSVRNLDALARHPKIPTAEEFLEQQKLRQEEDNRRNRLDGRAPGMNPDSVGRDRGDVTGKEVELDRHQVHATVFAEKADQGSSEGNGKGFPFQVVVTASLVGKVGSLPMGARCRSRPCKGRDQPGSLRSARTSSTLKRMYLST